MTYSVTLPDGSVANFPDDLPQSEALAAIRRHLAPPPTGGVMGELGSSTLGALSGMRTGLGAIFGNANAAAQAGEERRQEIGKQFTTEDSLAKIKAAYNAPGGGLLSAAKTAVGEVPTALAGAVPIMAEYGLPRIAGGVIGGALGTLAGPEGTIAGAELGSQLGGYAGMGLGYLSHIGSNVEEQAAEQKKQNQPVNVSTARAAAFAVPETALDVAHLIPAGAQTVGKVFGPKVAGLLDRGLTKEAEQAAQERLAQEGFWKTIGKGTAEGAAVGIPLMVAQTALGRAQAGQDLFSDDALAAYGSAATSGALGAPLGILGARGEQAEAVAAVEGRKREAQQAAAQLQREAEAHEAEKLEAFKQSPEYEQQVNNNYLALEKQRQDLEAQKIPLSKETPAADSLANSAIQKQIDELKPQINEAAAEYTRLKGIREDAENKLGEVSDQVGPITRDELQEKAPALLDEVDKNAALMDKEAGITEPLPDSYSLTDLHNLVDNPEKHQGLQDLIAERTGYDGKPVTTDELLASAQAKKINPASEAFKDFLAKTTGTNDLNAMSQPQLAAAFKGLAELPDAVKPITPVIEKQGITPEEIHAKLAPFLKKVGLDNVALNVVAGMQDEGSYASKAIQIALDADKPMGVLRHETIHGLKDLGFFTDQQWKLLENQADTKWIDQFLKQRNVDGLPLKTGEESRYDAYVKEYNGDMAKVREEAIADAFRNFDRYGAPSGVFSGMLNGMRNFFTRLKNAFNGAGFQTSDDLFRKIENGKLTPQGQESSKEIRGSKRTNSESYGLNILTDRAPKPDFGKKPTVDQVAQHFDAEVLKRFGRKLDYTNPADFRRAVQMAKEELKHQMASENSGLNWYDDDIKKAFEQTQRVIPSLASEPKRQLFAIMAGILSPETNARDNWSIAARAFEHYEKTGEVPGRNPDNGNRWQGGLTSGNKQKQMEFLHNMVQDLGEAKTLDWLYGNHTVKEINEFRAKYGKIASGIGGKASDQKPGLYAFGPKIGPFVSNINGIHDVTVDKWATRTFNRYFGTMADAKGQIIDAPTEAQRTAIKRLMNEAAADANIKNYQVQSALWFYEQKLFRKLGTDSASYGFSDGSAKFLQQRGGGGGEANVPSAERAQEQPRLSVRTNPESERGERGGVRDQGRSLAPLEGAPIVQGATGPDAGLVDVAKNYAKQLGIPHERQKTFVDVDPEFAARVAQAYEEMPHAPQDPKVKEAYGDMIRQTKDQYDALVKAGYKFDFFDGNTDPYDGNPLNAMRDLRNNKKMSVYGTYDGYGTEGITGAELANNPMLADTGLRWKDQKGGEHIVTANDLFRAVHDAFGHGLEGAGFRARGEENAWQAHAKLFTGPALGALTSETRGQNSWLNYGPYGEKNRTAKLGDTVFAEQKTGLMPSWTWEQNVEGRKSLRTAPDTPEFKRWFGNSDAVGEDGKPLVVYTATNKDFTVFKPGMGTAQDAIAAWVTNDKNFVNNYAAVKYRWWKTMHRPWEEDTMVPQGIHIIPAYVNPKKPFDVTRFIHDLSAPINDAEAQKVADRLRVSKDDLLNAIPKKDVFPNGRERDHNAISSDLVRTKFAVDAMRKLGFDSVKATEAGSSVYALFDSEQIKSAISNTGTYSGPDIRYSKRTAPDTPEFKQFFGKSTIVDENGQPKIMYHGLAKDTTDFTRKTERRAPIFLTDDAGFAEKFAKDSFSYIAKDPSPYLTKEQLNSGIKRAIKAIKKDYGDSEHAQSMLKSIDPTDLKKATPDAQEYLRSEFKDLPLTGPHIMPLYVRAETPFDYQNTAHVDALIDQLNKNFDFYGQPRGKRERGDIERGDWETIEKPYVKRAIKELGHDSFYVSEDGRKNLAVFDPTQVKSAIGNIGSYDRFNPDVRASKRTVVQDAIQSMPNGQGILDSMNKVATARDEKTYAQRITSAIAPDTFSTLRQAFIHKYNQMSVNDRRIAERMGGVDRLADQSAEAAALESDKAAGMTAAALGVGNRMGGAPVFRNGFTTISDEGGTIKGAVAIFAPLAKYGDPKIYQAYQLWAGAKRAERLSKEDREKLFSAQDIANGKALDKLYPEFNDIQKEWIKYSDALVRYQIDTGTLSEEQGKRFTEHSDYLPFYRQVDGDNTVGPKIFHNLSGVKTPKTLKGGEAPLGDFMENIVRNTQAAISSGLKNEAGRRAIRDVMELGEAERLNTVSSGPDVVTILEKGVPVSYRVADTLLVDAMKALSTPEMPLLSFLSKPANLLRTMVTKDPAFIMANMMKHSMYAYMLSGSDIKPITGTIKNFAAVMGDKSETYHKLLNAGVLSTAEFGRGIEASGKALEKSIMEKGGAEKSAMEKALSPITGVWQYLEKASEAHDAAVRISVYEDVMKKTGNEAEALHRALEVLNFNRRGNNPVVRIITATVPFLNAKLQGLDLMYRSGIRPSLDPMATNAEKLQQKTSLIRMGTLLGLSTMYAAAVMGNPEYENQNEEVRDLNWIIPGVGKFPIPFELGVLFKTIPEHIYRYYYGTDTAKDVQRVSQRALLDTLSFNPIPQAIMPALEAKANYSLFTQRPIVSAGMERLEPEYQMNAGTSKVAEQLGKLSGTSPMLIDHLIQGYTGTMGMYFNDLADAVFNQYSDVKKPSLPMEQMPIIKRFLVDPNAKGTTTTFYELKDAVDKAVATAGMLEKQGSPETEEFIRTHQKELSGKEYVQGINATLKEFTDASNAIRRAKDMTAEEKRAKLEEITKSQNEMLRGVYQAKKMFTE